MRPYKLVIMFFGMINLLATFQGMMNEILRDLINERKIAVFVDDMLIGIEKEEEHNKIVEEMLKRLEENNLYVKLEKYTWKVEKVNFLEVIMGQERIEIEEDKVMGVLN